MFVVRREEVYSLSDVTNFTQTPFKSFYAFLSNSLSMSAVFSSSPPLFHSPHTAIQAPWSRRSPFYVEPSVSPVIPLSSIQRDFPEIHEKKGTGVNAKTAFRETHRIFGFLWRRILDRSSSIIPELETRDLQVSVPTIVAKSFAVGKRLSHFITFNSHNNPQRQG